MFSKYSASEQINNKPLLVFGERLNGLQPERRRNVSVEDEFKQTGLCSCVRTKASYTGSFKFTSFQESGENCKFSDSDT
jgi:hypothetical protein